MSDPIRWTNKAEEKLQEFEFGIGCDAASRIRQIAEEIVKQNQMFLLPSIRFRMQHATIGIERQEVLHDE